MKHKWIALVLIALLGLLQYRLWFGKNSISDHRNMQQQITQMTEQNARLKQRNTILRADINDLKSGEESLEERARNELGLIKKGETFFRIVPENE
ncbi:MAG: cell division protein FtsB [Pseudomonadota bacterium]